MSINNGYDDQIPMKDIIDLPRVESVDKDDLILVRTTGKATTISAHKFADSLVSPDTGWLPFSPADPRIGLESGGFLEYRKIGSVLYFKYIDSVFLEKKGGSEDYILAPLTTFAGITYEEATNSTQAHVYNGDSNAFDIRLCYSPHIKAFVLSTQGANYSEAYMFCTTSIILNPR